jgi:hypothetical protein
MKNLAVCALVIPRLVVLSSPPPPVDVLVAWYEMMSKGSDPLLFICLIAWHPYFAAEVIEYW